MTENNFSNTNIGGTSLGRVSQIDPIFSYSLRDGGDIYVYVFDTSVAKVVVITLDDTSSEVAYACHTIISANVAHSLVFDAIEEFQEDGDDTPNPFRQLAEDEEAMRKLNDLLAGIFYRGE